MNFKKRLTWCKNISESTAQYWGMKTKLLSFTLSWESPIHTKTFCALGSLPTPMMPLSLHLFLQIYFDAAATSGGARHLLKNLQTQFSHWLMEYSSSKSKQVLAAESLCSVLSLCLQDFLASRSTGFSVCFFFRYVTFSTRDSRRPLIVRSLLPSRDPSSPSSIPSVNKAKRKKKGKEKIRVHLGKTILKFCNLFH